MADEYEVYLNKWLEGLYDEIAYWKALLSGKCKESCRLKESSNPNKRFTMEEELPNEPEKVVKFIDVGSGAFSRCGKISDKVKLEIIAVDPLADVYKFLKKEYNVENEIRLETGFVELLDRKFEKNTFDIVHMSNSLDHCFDAVFGIYQLLNICKIGGKVILRHHENEAEKDNYTGLHQWNLSLHNEESSFLIWRKDKKYDICKLFDEYVDFALYPDIIEDETGWKYNKVVMTKKKEIKIPPNDYAEIILENIYSFLIETLLHNAILEIGNQKMVQNRIMCKKIEQININAFRNKFGGKVYIYGVGMVGQKLFDFLKANNIEIVGIIDRRKVEYRGYQTISFNAVISNNKEIPILVTISKEFEEIEQMLRMEGWKKIEEIGAVISQLGKENHENGQ